MVAGDDRPGKPDRFPAASAISAIDSASAAGTAAATRSPWGPQATTTPRSAAPARSKLTPYVTIVTGPSYSSLTGTPGIVRTPSPPAPPLA